MSARRTFINIHHKRIVHYFHSHWMHIYIYILSGFKLVTQNWFSKNSECSKEKGLSQPKNFLDLQIILWKMQRVVTKFCKLTWNNMYYESLCNHVVIQKRVFRRLKITYYIASSMNNFKNSWSFILEKMQKLICKLPKRFANGKLETANLCV